MSRKEVQAIIDEVDENGDGKLDYKEVRYFATGPPVVCR